MPVAHMARKLLGARHGEERAVVLAFAYFFLLLCSYYLLRPVRDAMAANAGLGRLPALFTYTFIVMLVITPKKPLMPRCNSGSWSARSTLF